MRIQSSVESVQDSKFKVQVYVQCQETGSIGLWGQGKATSQRQLSILGKTKSVSEETIDDVVNKCDFAYFNQQVITDEGTSLTDANSCLKQEEEVVKLETNIHNLHNMFKDLKVAVNEQGEIINSIQHSMVKAWVMWKRAPRTLLKQRSTSRSSRKPSWFWVLFLPVHWYLDWWSLPCSPFSNEDIWKLMWVRRIYHSQWSLPTRLKTNELLGILKWSSESARSVGWRKWSCEFLMNSQQVRSVRRILRKRIVIGITGINKNIIALGFLWWNG